MKVYKWVPVKSDSGKAKKPGIEAPESKDTSSNSSHKENGSTKAQSPGVGSGSATAGAGRGADDKENGNTKHQTNTASSLMKNSSGGFLLI